MTTLVVGPGGYAPRMDADVIVVGAGLALMAVRMMRTVRADGQIVAEAAEQAARDEDPSRAEGDSLDEGSDQATPIRSR